jgi:hypothetical protein
MPAPVICVTDGPAKICIAADGAYLALVAA